MIWNYQRFINWRMVDRQRPDGTMAPAKVPWNYRGNHEINPHDPNNWRSYQDAAAHGYPVGFVITAGDPFFFLDMDKCAVNGQWTVEAQQIFAMFGGAAAEVSSSGQGLHIVGTCDKMRVADRRNKFGKEIGGRGVNWLEFYTETRFIAFGPMGWQGDFSKDCTDAILHLVPKREAVEAVLQAGPSPEYTGPQDDDELIQKMLNSRGSFNAMFGAKAQFMHLWQADKYADVLMQHFPSTTGDVYDRSSADAALMSHLAFWTGKDAARMDRLFRRSGLMRAKYNERPDYQKNTVAGAIRNCSRVYDFVKTATPSNGTGDDAAPQLGELLTIPEQIEYFKGCVYVRDMHRIMIPGGDLITPPQFKAYYGGKTFLMSADGSAPSRNAFEAFTENRAHNFPKVAGTCFRPLATPGAIIDNKVNVYSPYTPRIAPGDVEPFLLHLRKLFPVREDYEIILAYLAAVVQHIGVKFQWAPVIQGAEGNGKTLILEALEYAIGEKYSHRPAAEDLKNPFNSYLENKLLIGVEEIYIEGRRELLDLMKPLITNSRVETQPKGVDKRMVDNAANWIFLTNHRDAVPKSANDRRYAIFFTAQQDKRGIDRDGMSGDYFPRLYNWLRRGDGLAQIAHFLQNYQIPRSLNPATDLHRAPLTSTTPQAIIATLGRAEQYIREAVESQQVGFLRGWVSTYTASTLLAEHGIKMAPVKLAECLRGLGYFEVGRAEKNIMEEGLKRPVLYISAELYREGLNVTDYAEAQGYTSIPRAKVLGFPGARAGG